MSNRCQHTVIDRDTKKERKCKRSRYEKSLHCKQHQNVFINFEIGTCCFCGDSCNPCSQSCGGCARSNAMYLLGLSNTKPLFMK